MQRDDFACQTCIPVAEMKSGFRTVLMKDAKGNVIPNGQAKLLVHVSSSQLGIEHDKSVQETKSGTGG